MLETASRGVVELGGRVWSRALEMASRRWSARSARAFHAAMPGPGPNSRAVKRAEGVGAEIGMGC